MNNPFVKLATLSILSSFLSVSNAGSLGENHITLDLTSFSRDSDDSVTYLYDNSGTVNAPADDIPLESTGQFDDDADNGYRISGSVKLSGKWSLNASVMSSEMSNSDRFADAGGQLEVFRSPITTEFDGANSVRASYSSELSGVDLSAIYRYSDSMDFILGLGQLNLDERFRIISDDNGTVGVGEYVIKTENDMLGPHIGLALNHMYSDKFGVYLVGKVGWYDNDSDQRQRVDDLALTRRNRGSESGTSTVTDIQLGLGYHFTKQLALNFSYRAMQISDVALAESQFDTSLVGSNDVEDSGEIDWDGYNLGLRFTF